jgi:predicted RecA/RadA family phage recombinase
MKNYKGSADIVVVPAPEDASSGEFLKVGEIYGVAGIAVASGADVPLHRRGVFVLPKETGATWSAGDQLYWAAGTKVFSKDSENDTLVRAIAGAAAGSGDTTGTVILLG